MAIRWPSTRGMGAPSDPRRTNPHFASFVGRLSSGAAWGPERTLTRVNRSCMESRMSRWRLTL